MGAKLAARADRVQAELAAGRVDVARREATALRRETIAAVNAGEVPAELQEPLLGAVNRLAALIPKPEQAQPPAQNNGDEDKKDKKHDGNEGHD